jgi:hypothetical protein
MTTNLQSTSLSSYLYNQDYCLWLETTAKLLRNHQLDHVDFEHLIEEIEDMGKEKRRELKNRLIVLLMHLLKYQYQSEKRSSSWVSTIWEQFYQIERRRKPISKRFGQYHTYFLFSFTSGRNNTKTPNTIKAIPIKRRIVINEFSMLFSLVCYLVEFRC